MLGWGRWRRLGWLSCCCVPGGAALGLFWSRGAGGCPQGWPWCAGLVWGCRTWSSYGGVCRGRDVVMGRGQASPCRTRGAPMDLAVTEGCWAGYPPGVPVLVPLLPPASSRQFQGGKRILMPYTESQVHGCPAGLCSLPRGAPGLSGARGELRWCLGCKREPPASPTWKHGSVLYGAVLAAQSLLAVPVALAYLHSRVYLGEFPVSWPWRCFVLPLNSRGLAQGCSAVSPLILSSSPPCPHPAGL